MAIEYREIRGSQGGKAARSGGHAQRSWLVWGDSDPIVLRDYMLNTGPGPPVPVYFDGLVNDDLHWEETEAPDVWEFNANYVDVDRADRTFNLEVGESQFSFDTTGGQVLVTTSRETVASYPAGAAPDHKQAINVVDGAEPKGVTVVVPVLKFTIRKRQPKANIDHAYAKKVAALTGTVNADPQFSSEYVTGELLFMGAQGGQGTESDPEIVYHFAAASNESGLIVGDVTGIDKGGHEYLWVQFESVKDTTTNRKASRPEFVYVEKVYKEADWTDLAL